MSITEQELPMFIAEDTTREAALCTSVEMTRVGGMESTAGRKIVIRWPALSVFCSAMSLALRIVDSS